MKNAIFDKKFYDVNFQSYLSGWNNALENFDRFMKEDNQYVPKKRLKVKKTISRK
jgi:hypothetical protein